MNDDPMSPKETMAEADEQRTPPIPTLSRLPPDQMLRPWRTLNEPPPESSPVDYEDEADEEPYERLPRWTWQRVLFIVIVLFALLAFLLYSFSGLLIPPSDFPPTPTRPLDFT
jgi:hypothetical protein